MHQKRHFSDLTHALICFYSNSGRDASAHIILRTHLNREINGTSLYTSLGYGCGLTFASSKV